MNVRSIQTQLVSVLFFPQPVKSIIHALGHNRARQRDKLAHLLEEFGALQDEVRHCSSIQPFEILDCTKNFY